MELAYPKYTAILAAAAVVVRDGRLLLLEDRWGRWGLPSGFVEKGESAEETLRREVLEELGVECEIVAPYSVDIDWEGPEGSVFVLMHFAATLFERRVHAERGGCSLRLGVAGRVGRLQRMAERPSTGGGTGGRFRGLVRRPRRKRLERWKTTWRLRARSSGRGCSSGPASTGRRRRWRRRSKLRARRS